MKALKQTLLCMLAASVGPAACAAEPGQPVALGGGQASGDGTAGATGEGGADHRNTGGTSTTPDLCEQIFMRAEPVPPDLLIVLDRSMSMLNTGKLGVPRWPASVSGIKGVTSQLETAIRFGLMVFPGDSDDVCLPGEVKVEIDFDTADAIAQALDDTAPAGTTPTADSLRRAGMALLAGANAPDTIPHSKYVLLVTDGAPTCRMDANYTNGPDEENTFAAVSELAQEDIKTYVVGYDTRGSQFEATLDEMARRGGTGDTAHRPVEDEASLVAELERITATAISCTYALDNPVRDAAYVRVQIDGTTYPLGDGWNLPEPSSVALLTPACSVLRDGKPHALEITVECEPVVVQ